ncbi:PTS sugar transporter subunit IIA [Rhizobium sp. S95]|uniref:PTS sugar transporter subunit IIA n=1 Tax=Ciceribacter sichuanensis TaxID=2949647 RepID=A0AAJ1F6I1_9HYPH|nr:MULTISPECIES: PTS sugar transporter subunit IIA [unclassified Ciceribacter]MCM2397380.1 PTS sugar transporter subunit IIA [Ciceribacter sp. S95]MCM2403248.1 PTS sugar transporter subunit IIA [Ciceribacter sp. S153]MCO5958970.1 PTS sugar transporter subunit IIA [Ciceribacter sp. S101]
MKLRDCLPAENVVVGLQATTKAGLIRQLSELAADRLPVGADEISKALLGRERLGSTGIGDGIAVPHARVKGLDRHFCLFVRLAKAVDFEAVDELPVDLVFVLLNPDNQPNHLNILSGIARKMREDKVAQAVRTAISPADIYRELCPPEL